MEKHLVFCTYVIFFGLCSLGLTKHTCIHDEIIKQPDFNPQRVDVAHKISKDAEGRRLNSEDYQAIRIHIDDSDIINSSEITQAQKDYLTTRIVPDSKAWLEAAIKVIPVDGNLTLGSANCNGRSVDNLYATTGVSDADLIIFATAYDSGSSAAAWAVHCAIDNGTGRPIAGQINFMPEYVDVDDYDTMLAISIHEITHVLVFSTSLYGEFINRDTGIALGEANVIEQDTFNGRSRTRMILPTVVEKAKEHFGCSTLTGVELENQGESGSIGTHFETKIMWNDWMTAQASAWTQYSAITFALFYDSGWYDVNWDQADTFLYGKDQGCDFVEGSCFDTPGNPPTTQFPSYFCTEHSAPVCSFNYVFRGICIVSDYSQDLPAYWQYFSGSPRKGGQDAYMDYCPSYQPFNDSEFPDCTQPAEWGAGTDKEVFFTGRAETRGEKARCFVGAFFHEGSTGNFVTDMWLQQTRSSCHTVDCRNSKLYLKIDEEEVECPPEGGTLDLTPLNLLHGTLECPKYADICPLYNLSGEIIDDGVTEEEVVQEEAETSTGEENEETNSNNNGGNQEEEDDENSGSNGGGNQEEEEDNNSGGGSQEEENDNSGGNQEEEEDEQEPFDNDSKKELLVRYDGASSLVVTLFSFAFGIHLWVLQTSFI